MAQEYNVEALTRSDLAIKFNTGRGTTTGYGRDKTHHYRSGYMTAIGDIEQSEWRQLAEALVVRENGEEELRKIIEDVQKNCPWIQTDPMRRVYALNLYMRRGKA